VLVLMIIILARAHGITIWESASAVVGAPVVVMMLVMALGYLLN
jgi:hypothetical protein